MMVNCIGAYIWGSLSADLITLNIHLHTADYLYVRSLSFLHQMEEETRKMVGNVKKGNVSWNWCCSCGRCSPHPTEEENFCWREWDLLIQDLENLCVSMDDSDLGCVMNLQLWSMLSFRRLFHLHKINWKKRLRLAGPKVQLSICRERDYNM